MNEMMNMLNDLSGAIFKKAELENDFEKTYSHVFRKIVEMEITGGEEILEVLGSVGA